MVNKIPFNEIVDFALGGGWGASNPAPDSMLVAVIRGTDFKQISKGHVESVPRRWESEGRASKRLLQAGDLLIEISGGNSSKGQSTGRSILITQEMLDAFDVPVIPASFCRLVRVRPSIALPQYAYYALQDMYKSGRAAFYENQSTGISNFQFKVFLRDEKIRLPSLYDQANVVAVLGTLDDKIAVNDRIVATTAEFVNALFEQLIAEDTAVRRGVLGEVAMVNAKSVKKDASGSLRYVDISSVGVGSYERPKLTSWAEAPGRARRKASFGDTIWSTVRPNRRSHAFVLDDDPDLVFSTGLAVLSPQNIGPALLHESTRTVEFREFLEGEAEGSAYPAVRADCFKEAPVFVPADSKRCDEFESRAMSLWVRAHHSAVESRTLAELRDTLLPRLMSGELRVKDAEEIVEDVT